MSLETLDIAAEAVVPRSPELTRIEPATFRGVDCAVLAERYVAYRLGLAQGAPQDDADVIRAPSAPSSENV